MALADELRAAPTGVALLARLAGAEDVTWGELVTAAMAVVDGEVGPWNPGAPDRLARAYLEAPHGLADLLAGRFGDRLEAPLDLDAVELWIEPGMDRLPAFSTLASVYGNGEFPTNGLFTANPMPPEAHRQALSSWEYRSETASRWRLPVRDGARVHEIHRPTDWVALVERFPRDARRPHGEWELPGPNQHRRDIERLLAVPGQRGCRASITGHRLPDWEAAAEELDAVHLTWAGFLTCEGTIVDLPDGAVTMLRYWFSERTMWLRDVFGEPEPLDGHGHADVVRRLLNR